MLKGWDRVLSPASAPAALFEVWYRLFLRPALFERALAGPVPPEKLADAVAAATPLEDLAADARADLDLLEKPDGRLGTEPEETLAEIMVSSLARAVEHLEGLLGPDREGWEWGRLHHSLLTHPLSALVGEGERGRLNVGPAPRGGSGDTVGNTAYRADFRQTGGSSFRIAVDVGEWDNSLFMNSPGQSGDAESPHYSDLFEGWAGGGAFPLLYSRARVEEATEERVVLQPKGAS